MKKVALSLLASVIISPTLFAIGYDEGAIRERQRLDCSWEQSIYSASEKPRFDFDPQPYFSQPQKAHESEIKKLAEWGVKQAAGMYSVAWLSTFSHELGHLAARAVFLGPKTLCGLFVGFLPSSIDRQDMSKGKFVVNFGFNPMTGFAAFDASPQYKFLPKSVRKAANIGSAAAGPVAGIGGAFFMLNMINKHEKNHNADPLENLPVKGMLLFQALNNYLNIFHHRGYKDADGSKICSMLRVKPVKYNAAVAGLGLTALTSWGYQKVTSK